MHGRWSVRRRGVTGPRGSIGAMLKFVELVNRLWFGGLQARTVTGTQAQAAQRDPQLTQLRGIERERVAPILGQ